MLGNHSHQVEGSQEQKPQTLPVSIEASVTEAAKSQGDGNAVDSLSVAQRNRNSTNFS